MRETTGFGLPGLEALEGQNLCEAPEEHAEAVLDQGLQEGSHLRMLTKEDLCSLGQEHLFEGSPAEAEAILDQLHRIDAVLPGGGLRGYLSRARKLLQDAKDAVNTFAGKIPSVPEGEDLTGPTGPGSESYAELERVGMSQLAHCSFCLVAGGLGERLGYPGIKISICSEITSGITFIETYIRFILAFQAYARKETGQDDLILPLAIMTSGDTHSQTVDLLAENDNYGMVPDQITIMQQEKVPALMDVNARIAMKDGKVETKPHGHGDVHALLHQTGLASKWAGEGKRWLLLFQDTNPLPFRSLCAVLGVSANRDFTVNSVAVPRLPGEAIGGICKLTSAQAGGDEFTINVEYNELDPLLKTTPAGGDVPDKTGFSPYPGNINVLVFKLSNYAKCLDRSNGIVKEFVNPKWQDDSRTKFKSPTRLECTMQDFPLLCGPEDRVGFSQLERQMCFTCVKNNLTDAAKKKPPDCALSAEADIYACNARLLSLAGPKVEIAEPAEVEFLGIHALIGARIVLMPAWGISLEDMKSRVKGPVRISGKSALVLDGDVVLEELDLDGALVVRGAGVTGGEVHNAGCPLAAISATELDAQPPFMKIRGYHLLEGETEVRDLGP